MIGLLLEKDADANLEYENKYTVLILAIINNKPDIAKLILVR